TGGRFEYGARSEAAEYVGALLVDEAPAVASGEIQIVAVARRPGVLTKVAVRSQAMATIGGDDIARVRDRLDGERIDVVTWDHAAPVYISAALGVGKVPPMLLLPAISHARVLLGEIDMRGI